MEDLDIEFLIQHIILPPNVPQEEPKDLEQQNFHLLKFVAQVVQNYAAQSYGNTSIEAGEACKTLDCMIAVHDHHKDFNKQLETQILKLCPGDAFALHVVGQNAGITFRRIQDSLQLETFEVSPLREAVVHCKGRLRCTYPGPTTTIPWSVAHNPNFLRQLGEFLHHMTTQGFESKTLSKSYKGDNELSETRSSADPRFIIELFTGIMRGIGHETTPRHIQKNIRDEVNWCDAKNPWRRSGLWLVIRVVLQTTLTMETYKLLMLEVIRTLLERAIDSYAISCTSKKLARRCQKIEDGKVPDRLLQRILETTRKGSELLKSRWDATIAESTRTISWRAELGTKENLQKNTNLSLRNSLPWLQKRIDAFKSPSILDAQIEDPTEHNRFPAPGSFPYLRGGSETDTAISLIDFENWVKEHLEDWCMRNKNADVIQKLSSKIPEYHQAACSKYTGHNMLDSSRMVLTIFEMWVFMDSAVCLEKPLMRQYSPELPKTILEPLLFIQRGDMERVTRFEKYLVQRHSEATNRVSIFHNKASSESFASKYYQANADLKALRQAMEKKATEDRDAKKQELRRDNDRYRELMDQASQKQHGNFVDRWGQSRHDRYCAKCALENRADNMSIRIHEWPLPLDEAEARCVLFELKLPKDFAAWRDTTYYIMMDVCATDPVISSETAKPWPFDEWGDLRDNKTGSARIAWVSRTKPISGASHFEDRKIPAEESDVVVKHAGRYRLHDVKELAWVESRHKTCNVRQLCQSKILDHSYMQLSYAVNNTIHTPNEVIARQCECPPSLTLREYDAFATLRSGRFLQWHNILVEIYKRDLSFNKDAVYTLALHAVCHVGKAQDPNDWRRDSHTTLSEEEFSQELLEALQKSLSVLKGNWEQAGTLKLLILLAQRLVSCGHQSVQTNSINFLRDARRVCAPWITAIRDKIKDAEEESTIEELRAWMLRIAGIQCSAFDIDQHFIPAMFEDSMDIVEYLVCQNTIHDNSLGVFRCLDPDLALLLERNRRFAVLAEGHIQKVLSDGKAEELLSRAVQAILTSQTISGTWRRLESPATRWWVVRDCSENGGKTTTIHFNILEGKLLMNGKPNGRLPQEYFVHQDYKKLLGKRILDIIPSSQPGMSYQTKELFCGVALHFHLDKECLTILKQDGTTGGGNSKFHEFIPSTKFDGDIPASILRNGTQWLNLTDNTLRFHQSSVWWKDLSTSEDWILNLSDPERREMVRGDSYLLDMRGNIHASVHRILNPIEKINYIVTMTSGRQPISIDLPRYKLEFFINESNEVECRSLRGWTIDPNQGTGTFIGLQNFLKLRMESQPSHNESILVPFGQITWSNEGNGNHVSVRVTPPDHERRYAIYPVDRVLNRLLDTETSKARYTRLYLHALCSGILPDPLTGRTGVDEALDGLKTAASFSLQTLHESDAKILKSIASLTPWRGFYPNNPEVMQKIGWEKSLPTWVQNDNFYFRIVDIFADWSRRQFLVEGSARYEPLDFGSQDLLERAKYHNSAFSQGDYDADRRVSHCYVHSLRHELSANETHVYDIARASFQWNESNDVEVTLWKRFASLKTLSGQQSNFALSYTPKLSESDPITEWCSLYNWCRSSTKQDRFTLIFVFGSWVYANASNKEVLKSLVTVAASRAFQGIAAPPYDLFEPRIGLQPQKSFVEDAFRSSGLSFEQSEYASFACTAVSRLSYEDDDEYARRRRIEYARAFESQIDAATEAVMAQSSARSPARLGGSHSLLGVSIAMDGIRARFEVCYRNRALFEYFDRLKLLLGPFRGIEGTISSFEVSTMTHPALKEQPLDPARYSCSLPKLLSHRIPPDTARLRELRKDHTTKIFFAGLRGQMVAAPGHSGDTIRPIIAKLKNSTKPFTQKYADEVVESVKALEDTETPGSLKSAARTNLGERISQYRDATAICEEDFLRELQSTLSPQSDLEKLLAVSGLWPSLTKLDILQELRLKRREQLSREWARAIVNFGEAVTWLQRSNRLRRLDPEKDIQEIEKEIRNFEKEHWNAEEYIDWLLFEIDSGMMIRPVQARIGLDMMREEDNGNAVMQLNMGEGKSAVIMPIVTAALADTTRLVRSIVLKPLSTQMFQILVQRLSGLCDRKIYFLPFHRGLSLDSTGVAKIQQLYDNCKSNGDILLTLPEHLLSFKLMGLEKLVQGEPLWCPLIETQKWLDQNSRDVLDESDEILHTRYQLIYTMGKQESLEGDRDRWTLIQDFLDLLQEQAGRWAKSDPTAVEVLESSEAGYPRIRIIDKERGEKMLHDIAKEICFNGTKMMPSLSSRLRLLKTDIRDKVFSFITIRNMSLEPQETVLRECEHIRVQLLVLRGLIAHGILLFVLRDKRYRVDYGLDTKRSNLAVPYRAKDRPAVKAEFGHPEVVLILTCLTYYYGGLEESNLESCFELLFRTDDPVVTFEHWLLWVKRRKEIPPNLSQLQGLNLRDQDQKKGAIFPFFKYNKYVIDFFLSELIFPREAKGFPHKLSTSGWDIAQRKTHNTTGFSGTNDNRYLLPTSIKQLDLPQQLHTNSLVLMNILREENNSVTRAHKNDQRLTATEMLWEIANMDPKVQVLLDVGAQILELTNHEVAREWLRQERSEKVKGAVFFGNNDEILVMRRDGKIEPFLSSSLSNQLDQALVYLDEAHTRGTDLKLPVGTRAAVTLGPNLAKDKFVQGCMRMRKLGSGHSLAFLASPDIYGHILKQTGKSNSDIVTISDVLVWTMRESCRQIQQGFAVWANQGFQYLKRKQGWDVFQSNGDNKALQDATMEVESRPLVDMYGPNDSSLEIHSQVLTSHDGTKIKTRLKEFSVDTSNNVRVQEEQEREVAHEVEEETNVERPQPAKAKRHQLAAEVSDLVRTGKFESQSSTFKEPFSIFENTSCRHMFEVQAWKTHSRHFVTKDFTETVERNPDDKMDDYLRPVRWVLEFNRDDESYLVFISPYEANELMPDIKRSEFTKLHCYAPRVSRSMPTFEYFDVCPIQGLRRAATKSKLDIHSRIRLNLFAGQLFFEHENYYRKLCNYLSLDYGTQSSLENRGNDGWVPTTKTDGDSVIPFTRSPVLFLKAIIKMRRKGQGFASTHLGCLLDSRLLGENDFK
ncbi:hypothetical protein TWF281_008666 [Arthrobotrys megalospora]